MLVAHRLKVCSLECTARAAQAEGMEKAVAAASAAVARGQEADFEAQLRTKAGERLWSQVQLRHVQQNGSTAADNLVRAARVLAMRPCSGAPVGYRALWWVSCQCPLLGNISGRVVE